MLADPALFLAVTVARRRKPTSAVTGTYDDFVAPLMFVQVPEVEQRCHWYVYVSGVVPFQLPLSTVTVCPTCAVPCGSGCLVTLGGVSAATTTAVRLEAMLADPALFLAVTVARRRKPTSAVTGTYDDFVAPLMFVQVPEVEQRCHWYVYVSGVVPFQLPLSTVTVCPTCAVPCGSGCLVTLGGVSAATTVPVGLEAADEWPAELAAATTTRSVPPTSEDVTTYVWAVAPEMSPQLPPEPLHRCHVNV